ncbi:LamG-like jellyroll fold domain-containing protein [Mesotoga sp.]|uniref:LamG-like jellyroll fold domain-containing protein n=1 Tax=Mesotoga sp. TaxID=2053577 RepID=UPI00345EBE30
MKNKFLTVCLFALLFSVIFLLLGCPSVSESPTLNIPNQTVDEGQVLQFDLKQYATDKNKNALTFTIMSGVGEIVGTDYTYLPNYTEAGLKSVTIKVTNLNGKSVQSTFNIEIVDTPIEIEVQKLFKENKTLISWQEVANGTDRIVVEKKVEDGVFAQIDELTEDATHCEDIVVANVRNTYRIKLYMETAFDTSNEVMFQFFESEDDIQFEFDGITYTIDKEFSAENTEFSIREESGILHIDMLVDDQAPEASYKTSEEYSTYLTCPLVWPISLSWVHSPGSYYAEVSRRIVQITPISYFEYEPYEIPITSKEISGQTTDRLIVDFVPLDAAAAFFEFIEPIGLKQYTASILGYHEIEEYEHLVYFEPSNDSATGYKKYSETVNNNFEPKNDFALIFIHGKQGTRIGESAVTGEDEEQRERWAEFYKKFNSTPNTFDYFEYYYDSNVRTATEYGKELYRIMDTAGIFGKYEKIFIISHSMGGLVSRGLLKELDLNETAKIGQVYTLDTPHEGSPLASLIRAMTDENAYNNKEINIIELIINNLQGIRILIGTIKADDLDDLKISDLREAANSIVYLLKEAPIIVSVIIANYGRNLRLELAPYPGYTSIEYTYQDYLDNLSTELNNVYFPANTELNGLKTNLDKITYIKGKIATTKFQPSEEITIADVGLLLCQMIFEEFADIAGMPAHAEGDGFVSLISQSLGGNEVLFDGINHDRITKDEDVVSYVHNDVIGRLDNSIPSVTKVSGPNGEVSESSSTFTWSGSDSDGTITKYEYKKDEGSWVSNGTSTSYTWSGYSEGPHKFEVRAQDNDEQYSNVVTWSFTYSALIPGEYPKDGLIAYWGFNQGIVDGKVIDESVNGHDGTVMNNPEIVDGILGNGMRFHGKNYTGTEGDHVLLPDLGLSSRSSFTMSLWANEIDTVYPYYGEAYICNGGDSFIGIAHLWDKLYFSVSHWDSALVIDYDPTFMNTFTHYCLVFDDGLVKAYINGISIDQKEQNISISRDGFGLAIHWWDSGEGLVSTRFGGILDEVLIYNRALSSEEVYSLYSIPIS